MNPLLRLQKLYLLVLLVMLVVITSISFSPALARTEVTVITTLAAPVAATDGNFVYLAQQRGEFCSPGGAPSAVIRVPVTGGSFESLYESCDFYPESVRMDGAQMFIQDAGRIVKLPTTGGIPVKIADMAYLSLNGGFDIDRDFVYWADSGGLKKAFKTGSGTTTLVEHNTSGYFNSVTVDDTYVYYLHNLGVNGTYKVMRVPRTGGTAQELYVSQGCWTSGGGFGR